MQTQTWKVILAFTGVFIAGTVTGGFLSAHWIHREQSRQFLNARPPTLEQFGKSQLSQLSRKLELSELQREQMKPLVSRAGDELKSLRRHTLTETIAVFTRFNEEVSKILTPEQQPRFEEFRKQQRARLKSLLQGVHREGSQGPHRGPPPPQGPGEAPPPQPRPPQS